MLNKLDNTSPARFGFLWKHAAFALIVLLSAGLAMASLAVADSYEAEAVIGDRLAAAGFQRYGMPIEDDAIQTYVNRVGAAVARNAGEPDTPFYFAALDNDRIIASWSCPAGIVAVTTGFLRTMKNEAELAGVLAHETVHATGRHPLRTYGQTEFKGPAGTLPELIRRLSAVVFEQGVAAPLEHAADARGMEIAFRTGYDPEAFVRLLERLQALPDAVRLPGSWFKTHPPLGERINRCETRLAKFRDAAGLALAQDRFADVMRRLP